ncbi:MAG TPA: GNAT family N-acetyltransferase [Candidatus Acidoferrales bacterium]|nr:GNAT family N-acetyltransferase [Candidatus Acidoferrales bacterium]
MLTHEWSLSERSVNIHESEIFDEAAILPSLGTYGLNPSIMGKSHEENEPVMESLDHVTVANNEEAHRFEARLAGETAGITYRRIGDQIVFLHTEVPAKFEGKGVATKLVRTALDFARMNHLRVIPLCPFVASYIRKHAEYQDLLSQSQRDRLLAEPN